MPYTLGSLTFPSSEHPNDGEIQDVQPQKWSEFEPIGASTPGTLLTYISSPSIKMRMHCVLKTATKDSLKSIYNARAAVTWITPDDVTGFLVVMTELTAVRNRALRGTGRWDCWFTLVKAS